MEVHFFHIARVRLRKRKENKQKMTRFINGTYTGGVILENINCLGAKEPYSLSLG